MVSGKVRELLRSDVRRVEITLADVNDDLTKRLAADGFGSHRVGDHLVLEFEGDTNIPKALNAALSGGARVVEVISRGETLEDLFMRRAIGPDVRSEGKS